MIGSRDASTAADISPKGDPLGFIRILHGHTVAIPDRPGNHRTDTFHNIIEDPGVAILAVVPGEAGSLELRGTATVTDDRVLLASMQVKGKAPDAAMLVSIDHAELGHQRAIEKARPWDPAASYDFGPAWRPTARTVWPWPP